MDAAADATPLGAWASIRGYFTPATLFLVVNLVIGTIALTSRVSSHQRRRRDYHLHYDDGRHPHPHHQEPLHPHQHQQQEYHRYYHPEQQPQYVTPPPPAPAPLSRTSSVLDRLRSLGLYRFRSGDFPPEYGAAAAAGANHTHDVFSPVVEEEGTAKQAHYARSRSEPAPAREDKRPAPRMKKSGSEARKAQVARAPALVAEAVAENEAADAKAEDLVGSFRREPPPQQAAEYHYQEEYVPPAVPAPAPAPLARAPSILERLRSVDLYGFLAPAQPAAAPAPARGGLAAPADEKKQAAHYNRSRSEPTREEGKTEKKQQAAEARMAKSSSVARKPAGPRLVEADDCVDARAEAFIDSFRREYVTPPPAPPQQKQQQAHHDQDEHVVPPPPPLARTASVLDRLRSFGLYRFRSGDLGPDHPAAESTPAAADGKAHYGSSRSEPPQGKKEKKPQGAEARRMSKSSSESIVEEAEPEACVDARADDFINKFRQQLQLQRLNSLLNYKEMLTGSGKQQ